MRYELKRIALWPFIKVSFFINLLIGFIFGLFYSPIVSVIMMLLTATPFSSPGVESAPASWGALLFIIPFISAFLAGLVNTLIGLVLVLAYNMFSVMLGGLEFELENVRPDTPPAPPTKPLERSIRPVIYADSGDTIPPPPPPPPVHPRENHSAPPSPVDQMEDTGRVSPHTTSLTSAAPEDTLSEPGGPSAPFAFEPKPDRPDESDTEGKQS